MNAYQEAKPWKSHSHSYLSLGCLYSPDITPAVASRRLKMWIIRNPQLVEELIQAGWNDRQRILTPRQVDCIVRVLGEP